MACLLFMVSRASERKRAVMRGVNQLFQEQKQLNFTINWPKSPFVYIHMSGRHLGAVG